MPGSPETNASPSAAIAWNPEATDSVRVVS